MTSDNSLGDGVFYAMDDYASIMRRVAVMVIDTGVLIAFGVFGSIPLLTVLMIATPQVDPSGMFFIGWVSFSWFYLTVLRRSKFRTLGYILLGLKIVTTKGDRPTLFAMTYRMLMWIFGPVNFVFDLIWLGADSEQQSLRDCYAGTYVVRNAAEPIGVGPLHLCCYFGAGLALFYPRVVRPKAL